MSIMLEPGTDQIDKSTCFAKVYPELDITAKLKQKPEDFIVEENLDIDFSGDGEHCWIYVQKTACNTDWLAQQIAKYCGVKRLAVAYAGLKDRHAISSQWFSVQLPGKPMPDWRKFETSFARYVQAKDNRAPEKIKVLKSFRHNKKLQRGALQGNNFRLRLREPEYAHGSASADYRVFDSLNQRCLDISKKGVPNYFGPQRFGRNHSNLDHAIKLFSRSNDNRHRTKISRNKRSLYLSAARSWIFNNILSERIKDDVWDKRIEGDVFMLDGRSACFKDDATEDAETLDKRLINHEIHPTAVLWGEGDVMVTRQAAELESRVVDCYPQYRDGLISARLQLQRRACRVIPQDIDCRQHDDDIILSFSLPAGSYATMVLAEIFSGLTEFA